MVSGHPPVDEVDDGDAPALTRRERRQARPRRTWGQRLVLALGVVLSVLAIAAAATAGYLAWKWKQVDRTDVALDELIGDGPANFLIVGSDTRKGGDPTDPRAVDDHKPLADTIMIVRIDAADRQAKVLSLPRDLWVRLAGTGQEGRINAAYAGGGPQRLVDTLQNELDIPIHHYMEVDFKGFQGMVSAVGGVPMWFDRAMRDRNSGLDVLHPGCTVLDGYGALAFARARHLEYFSHGEFAYDGTGDLGRISRQQLFMRRLIDRAKTKGIRNPLTLKRLIDVGTSSVTLDNKLGLGDLSALGKRFADFRSDSLLSYTLPTTARTTSGGAQVLDLEEGKAKPILDLFRTPADLAAKAEAEGGTTSGDQVDAADVVLWVLNSSGRQGLAVDVADHLVAGGYEVDHWGNGAELDHTHEDRTIIRYGEGAGGAAQLLATRIENGAVTEADRSLERGQVVLFLGDDFDGLVAKGEAPATTVPSRTTATDGDATTSTSEARTTTTTAPPPAEVVGMVPGDPPPGRSCG